MAFELEEIEDGTAKATALVYAPTSDAVTYLTRRGRPRFVALAEDLQDVHFLRGTEYVEVFARPYIRGLIVLRDQGLLWPRWDVWYEERLVPGHEVPKRWIWATFEAAELSAAGQPLLHVVDDKIGVRSEMTGRSIQTSYDESFTKLPSYRVVERMLTGLISYGMEIERG